MRIDELYDMAFEKQIAHYSESFKHILRKSRTQARAECDKWETLRQHDPLLPHPIELVLGKHLPQLHT